MKNSTQGRKGAKTQGKDRMEEASNPPPHPPFAPLRPCALALISYALIGFIGALGAEKALPGKGEKMVDPLVISSCDEVNEWAGGSLEPDLVKQGKGAIRWEHGRSSSLSLRNVPKDWSAHNTLSMRIYSAKATHSRFLIYIGSENPKTEGADYYSASIKLDFEGWRSFAFSFAALGSARSPLGWDLIDSFRFTAAGWGNTPHPEAIVIVDDIRLTWTPPATGPRLTDEVFFEAMDLDLPALSEVRKAVADADYPAAKRALAAHIKARKTPKWHFDWRERPRHQTRPEGVNTSAADRIVAHELTSCGITYEFGDDIDWSINPTKLKYREWTWQLSRHPFWRTLGRAYWATGDEVYAKDFVFQMTDWVTDNPVPVNSSGNSAGSRWRTIETGIRMFSSWPDSFFYFLSSPSFDDESITLMIKSMVEHARHLMAHPSGSNNWLAMEMNGLFHVGTLFPEFRDAATWRETASGRLYEQMNIQVYPDGAQIELATGYHGVSLHNFLGTLRLAKLNEIELPGDYVSRLEKMYDYYVKLAMPDGRMPALNDAGWGSVRTTLRQGFELFPKRRDFEYLATQSKSGSTPSFTSVHFPYAGWAVMRTGWAPKDLYMHFEYGPFGAAHQHEDKLSLIVHAYGKRLLTEGACYAYDSSQWRRYVLSARAHNVVMVDGMEQHRRRLRETYVTDKPLSNRWITTDQFDYAEGTYDEGYGKDRDKTVTHHRAVLFVKPKYWLVVDRLVPSDDRVHRYDAVFHFDVESASVKEAPLAAVSGDAEGPNLAVVPLRADNTSVEIVVGQEEPTVQGWVPAGGYKVRPVATPIVSVEASGVTVMPYLLYPLRAGEQLPIENVKASSNEGMLTFVVSFADGHRDVLTIPEGMPDSKTDYLVRWSSHEADRITAEIGIAAD